MHNGEFFKLFAFGERLIDAGIGIIGDAKIEVPHAFWGRDSKVVALALLSRTLSNFKGAAIMVREDLLVEAQVLTRCCFENLISIAGLHTDGAKFIEALVRDEAASRRKRGKFLLERQNPEGQVREYEAPLREYIKTLEEEYPKASTLNQRQIAESTVLRDAYIYYGHFSAIATHVSASSLSLHLKSEIENGQVVRTLEVAPVPTAYDLKELFLETCDAMIGVAVTANEIIGGTPTGESLRALMEEHRALQIEHLEAAPEPAASAQ
jgi:hypothetical protein